MTEGIDYYEENGKFVLTSFFLWNRGYCCDHGCRNCPYRTGKTREDVLRELKVNGELLALAKSTLR